MAKLSFGHRLWRKLPVGARRAGLSAITSTFAPRADPAPPASSHGVVVAGELLASTGVGAAARIFLAAATAAGLARGAVTLGVGRKPQGDAPPDAAVLLAVNAPSLSLMLARADTRLLRGRCVIGIWAWELPVVPAFWAQGARYVHEVWAGSQFTAQALESVMPGKVRVVPLPLAMSPMLPAVAKRDAFGLPMDAVVTVMVFALGSSFARKNPLAGIAAFKQAFGEREDQILVVKFSGEAAYPREAAQIRAYRASNIRCFEGEWTSKRVAELLACADILLSLHRSEGFGLIPAEAMLRGIPVIATGWSGNLQFMNERSAAMVNFQLVRVVDESHIYHTMPGAFWAEPDIGHAAAWLRQLGDDPIAREALGRAGQAYARQALNGDAFRRALADNKVT